jgi:putative ABC transport system permease protein
LLESTLLDAWVLAMFGVTAASLAAIGLFAMMSAIVRQHEHEIAIRMALGATPSGIRASLMWRGLALSAAGLVLGTAGGIALRQA